MKLTKQLIMKNIVLLFSLMLGSWAFAKAQITLTNASFPVANDSLQTSTDLTVSNIKIAKNGVNQVWDFRTLNATGLDVIYVKNASEGKSFAKFPNAELIEKRGTLEYYINVTATNYEEIGVDGATPEFFNIPATTNINPARIVRRAPLNFFDLNNTSTATTISIPLSALPDTLLGQLGQLTSLIDSIRVKFSGTRTDLVDGYGTVKLPIGDFEVLREKRINYTQSDIEARLKLTKSWINLSTFIGGGQLPPAINNFLGKDTTFTYNFYSNAAKEPIAIATMSNSDNTQATEIAYKNIRKPVATKDEPFSDPTVNTRPDIKAMPNPAIDIVNFELTNLQSGNYTIKIYNLLGSVVWEEQHVVVGSKTVRLDTNNLKKGTYLYSLSDSKGRILSTKRLIVLKA
jgi:hypothetical protein